MKIFFTTLIVALSTCAGQRQNLDYPTNIENIEQVTLSRTDKESKGKFATIKDLTDDQTEELLNALSKAKPVGPMKFMPDYYIVFTTKTNETMRIKINGNKIKGYDSTILMKLKDLNFWKIFK